MSRALRRLVSLASQRYRSSGRAAYHAARGKLGGDPLFAALLAEGLVPDGARILDLGCGRALLASWLLAADELQVAGEWPREWPQPARPRAYRGIELLAADVRCAARALGGAAAMAVEQGDIRNAALGKPDLVLLLDAIHYIEPAAQLVLLDRIGEALGEGGLLLMRVADAHAGLRFRFGSLVDRLVCRFRGLHLRRLHARPLAEWTRILDQLGFAVAVRQMSAGTPFANSLLVARAPAGQRPPSQVRIP